MNRRFDIDWIRVIAIGLLIIYHSAIAFQPWGTMIAFVTNKDPWAALWLPMGLLNVWRIPLLFFVSGMGVYFAMRSRTPKQLVGERARRILVPYLFGIFFIVPIQISIWRYHNGMRFFYTYDPAHLWFLGNIFAYVVIWVLVFYLVNKNGEWVRRMFSTPLGILIVIAALMTEALIIKPVPYELYAATWHGFFLGMIAFVSGYVFAFTGIPFWNMITKWKWVIFGMVVVLAALRLQMITPSYMIPAETVCWVLSVLVLGYKYLNKDSSVLSYLSEAAYPVYIVHLVFQNLGASLLSPLNIPVPVKFMMLVLFTLAGCLLTYEVIKRTRPTRFLFGLKPVRPSVVQYS
jgi:glucan biosynthesis protein C